MSALVRVEGVRRDYRAGGDVVHAVRGVDLAIDAGEWVAIVGPSGCGKSTLLNLLGAIDTPSAGRLVPRRSRGDQVPAARCRLHLSAVLPHAGAHGA